jgi:phage I-like protein
VKVLLDLEPFAGSYLVALKSAGGNKVPDEFRIFPFGTFSTDKGEFKFDEEGADLIIADRQRRKARVQIDYDHLAIKSEKPGDGKAFGWCDLEKRGDGLYAVNITWTPAGQKALEDGEYASFSPFFGATKKEHRIVMLFNIAATNLPAMHDAEMLVAAARRWVGNLEIEVDEAVTLSTKEKTKMKASKLGGYLSSRMKKDGLSMKALADKSGMGEERLRALHDGEDATPEEMKALGKAFGMKDGEIEETVDATSASSFDNAEPETTTTRTRRRTRRRSPRRGSLSRRSTARRPRAVARIRRRRKSTSTWWS